MAAKSLFALFFALSFFVSLVVSNYVYISPFGNDGDNGGSYSEPFQTLGYAIDYINPGDTVIVQPGVYSGSNNFPDIEDPSYFVITSDSPQSDPSNYVFDASTDDDYSNSFSISNGMVSFVGLTFRNFQGDLSDGSGIITIYSNVTVDGCVFSDNSVGIVVQSGNLSVVNSQLWRNNYGIFVQDTESSSAVSVQQSTISGPGSCGVLISAAQQTFSGQDITIENLSRGISTSTDDGTPGFSLELDGSTISGCSSNAIYLEGAGDFGGSGQLILRDSTISYNHGTIDGSGVYIGASMSLLVQSSSFTGNQAERDLIGNGGQGAGIYCDGQGTVNLDGVTFANNIAYDGATAWCNSTCTFSTSGDTSTNNTETTNTGPCSGLSD